MLVHKQVKKDESSDLEDVFKKMDTDHSGSLDYDEYMTGFKEYFGSKVPESEIK